MPSAAATATRPGLLLRIAMALGAAAPEREPGRDIERGDGTRQQLVELLGQAVVAVTHIRDDVAAVQQALPYSPQREALSGCVNALGDLQAGLEQTREAVAVMGGAR